MPFISLKKLTRPRTNSQSYADGPDYADGLHNSTPYDSGYGSHSLENNYTQNSRNDSAVNSAIMSYKDYSAPQSATQQDYSHGSLPSREAASNAYTRPLTSDSAAAGTPKSAAPVDLFTHAFNQAISPYTSRIEELEAQHEEFREALANADAQQADIFKWIDLRGLRPYVPDAIAARMDAMDTADKQTAAKALSAQLDRKITIVNFDMHRLQDDLNKALPLAHFSACMLSFLKDVERLSNLAGGPAYACDLVCKLGANVNSHEDNSTEDERVRCDFYDKLDDAMVKAIRKRIDTEGHRWDMPHLQKVLNKFITLSDGKLHRTGAKDYYKRSLALLADETHPEPEADHSAYGKGLPSRTDAISP